MSGDDGGGWSVMAQAKAQQNRTEQNRQKLKNRKNIQEQTKPYLQNKQLILACGSRARQRLPDDGQKCDMESQSAILLSMDLIRHINP